MNKFRKFLLAIVASLAVVLGGVVTAAPAQAVWGTSVYLEGIATGSNTWVRTTNMVGTDKIIHWMETARNVRYFEPPSTGWGMIVTGPGGSTRNLEPGEGYTPTNDGTYRVTVYRAG